MTECPHCAEKLAELEARIAELERRSRKYCCDHDSSRHAFGGGCREQGCPCVRDGVPRDADEACGAR